MSTINNPAKKSLSSVFDKNVYHIPKYQRAYAWEENNWIELWSDIENYIYNADKEHFLGAIIHYHSEHGANQQLSHYDVIDGQQRLTTITILLRVIYEKLKSSEKEVYQRFADEIYKKYIGNTANDTFYINLSKKDELFFRDYIQKIHTNRVKVGKLLSNKNIRKCYEFFLKKIEIFSSKETDPLEAIWQLKTKLEANLIFVVIDVNSDVDAYMIFESINSKRQGLTISDLLKNYIFMAADQQQRQMPDSNKLASVEAGWDSMESTLDKIEVNQYIRHYWISRYEKVFEKELYQKIKQRLGTAPEQILSFFDEVSLESDIYSAIVNADVPGLTQEGRVSLESLKHLRNRQYYPLLLSTIATNQNLHQISALIVTIASVAVRRSIMGKNPNELELFFADMAIGIRTARFTVDQVIQDLANKFTISNDDIVTELKTLNFKDQEYLAKFILKEYEASSHHVDEKKLSSVSLEHVLPQRPEGGTVIDLAGNLLDDVVWNIGNLALIHPSTNNKMSNKVFDKKRKDIEKSQIKTTAEIAANEHWGYKEILQRNDKISKFVINNWRI